MNKIIKERKKLEEAHAMVKMEIERLNKMKAQPGNFQNINADRNSVFKALMQSLRKAKIVIEANEATPNKTE